MKVLLLLCMTIGVSVANKAGPPITTSTTLCDHMTPSKGGCMYNKSYIFIDRVAQQGDNGIGSVLLSVRPSIHPSALSWLNCLTYDLDNPYVG